MLTTPKERDWTKFDVMIFQSKGFQFAANHLQSSLAQIVPKKGGEISVPRIGAQVMGYFCSAVMLRAFAVELVLKALSLAKTGTIKKGSEGHDLVVLFKDLDAETRDLVGRLQENHGVAAIEGILAGHRNDFVDWRYYWERGDISTKLLDLDKALTVLLNAAEHREFKESCYQVS